MRVIEAQSLHAQRLQTLGTLAGSIAHNLNNALAPIMLMVSVLRDNEGDLNRREDLAVIETSAQHCAEIVRQMLSFARGVGVGPGAVMPSESRSPPAAARESALSVAATALRLHGNGELVLVVDDEEAIRRLARCTLERFGYRTLLACNGAEAVTQYALHGDEIAVVVTDMVMPVMDGSATIAALKTMNPKVRIVRSSGLDAYSQAEQAAEAMGQYFVPKPYTAETMLRALRRALAEPT